MPLGPTPEGTRAAQARHSDAGPEVTTCPNRLAQARWRYAWLALAALGALFWVWVGAWADLVGRPSVWMLAAALPPGLLGVYIWRVEWPLLVAPAVRSDFFPQPVVLGTAGGCALAWALGAANIVPADLSGVTTAFCGTVFFGLMAFEAAQGVRHPATALYINDRLRALGR